MWPQQGEQSGVGTHELRPREMSCMEPSSHQQESEALQQERVKALPRRTSIIKDPTVPKAGGGRKKTVSFSSMPSEKKVSSVEDCLAFMQGGCELKKVRPNSRIYCRFYTLDPDFTCLRWEPSKKNSERARLDISIIHEVRAGKTTDSFHHHGSAEQLPEEAAFSIIHGDGCQSLDLVALSADVAKIWITGLRHLVSQPEHTHGGGPENSLGSQMRLNWLAAEFGKSDEDGNGIVSEDVAVATICRLCPGITEAKVCRKFKEIQRSKEKLTSHVTLEEFQEAYCELCTRPEIYFLLMQLSQDRECLDTQDLQLFLETEQGLTHTTAEGCLDIVQRFEPSVQGQEQGILGLDGFARYLQSPECHLFDPVHRQVCQNMSFPLSHYYISASFHSYLLEDHLHGWTSLGGLLQALQVGCRCVELCVTDGPEGEPMLRWDHGSGLQNSGKTPAVPITARSAIELINKHAFLTSPYPLLVYLCQQCSPAQQQVLAQHLHEVFGARLCTPEALPATQKVEWVAALPSPEELKGRVLLAGNKLPEEEEGSEGEVSEVDEDILSREPFDGWQMLIPGEEELDRSLRKPLCFRLCRELSEMMALKSSGISYFHSYRAQQMRSSTPISLPVSSSITTTQDTTCWILCSLGERQAMRVASKIPKDVVAFTKTKLMRVRPSSLGVDYSSPSLQDFWKLGCQMVVLNMQSPGTMLDLHRALFAQNGACGFVLRPGVLREEDANFSASTQGYIPGMPSQTLRIKVISAQNLVQPQGSDAKGKVIDPYVVLELHGVPADCAEQRTHTAAQNQDNPLFDESFEFQVNMPELAILRFVVLDDGCIGDDFIGQYSVVFDCLQPGYRTVPLLGLEGKVLPYASLFVHVAITNRYGGGKAHTKSLSVLRGAHRDREYLTLRNVGIKALDDNFSAATVSLMEAIDLRVNVQSTTISFKEQCGLPPLASLKQCTQSLTSRLQSPEGVPVASLVLRDGYPYLDAPDNLPEVVNNLLATYNTMISAYRQLIENAGGVQEKISEVQKKGMELHEDLARLAEKEGLRGRKQTKAVESSAWNITILRGQCDLLFSARIVAMDSLQQLTLASTACGLIAIPDPLCTSPQAYK
ncbi:inactive phospholipase C-like protein 1 [Arapaima gigas]